MQIRISTDSSVEGSQQLAARVETFVESALERFAGQITRVVVHLSDENSRKGGVNDKRCAIEARLGGLQPLAVTHQAATVDQAVAGAADKLHKAIESTIGRLRDRS